MVMVGPVGEVGDNLGVGVDHGGKRIEIGGDSVSLSQTCAWMAQAAE